MTNLKIATGIADNRLSAHHPDGAGTETSFGMFFIHGFDTAGFNSWDPDNRTLRPGDEFSLWLLPPAGSSQVTENVYGDEYVIRGSMVQGNKPSLNLSVSGNLIALEPNFETVPADPNISGTTGLEIVLKALDNGIAFVELEWNDGGINSDVDGYNTRFTWSGTIQAPPVSLITSFAEMTPNAGEILVTYDFEDGKSSYTLIIEQRSRPSGSTDPGEWSLYANVFQTTYSQPTQDSNLFTGLSTSLEYQHRVVVTDGVGESDSGETPIITPTGTV